MDKKVFSRFSEIGLIKSADQPRADLDDAEKARLNRKGNELLNRGEQETARRIFETTGYSDGLIRIGDACMKQQRPVDALKMYWLAHDEKRTEALVELAVLAIQKSLQEVEDEKNERPVQGRITKRDDSPGPERGTES